MNYTDDLRGIIQNRERKKQILDYSGLKYGQCTPSDVDGLLEYHDSCIILYEYKLDSAPMPHGQRQALERLCNAIEHGGKPCLLLVCQHDVQDCGANVDAAAAVVRELYTGGRWYTDGKRTAKEYSDYFIKKFGGDA